MSLCVFDHDGCCANMNVGELFGKRCIEADNLLKNEQTLCKHHYDRQLINASDRNAAISHPSHYVDGRKYEPKDVIRDWNLNFNLGSAVKYISRAGRKDDIIQDLKKAKQFIDFEIEALAEELEKTNGN